MKTARERRVIIQVEVSFKDADSVLALVEELGLNADVTLPTLARAKTARRSTRRTYKKRKVKQGYHQLTKANVSEIFKLSKDGRTPKQVAAAIGCGPTSVLSVLIGKHRLVKKLTKDALATRISVGK